MYTKTPTDHKLLYGISYVLLGMLIIYIIGVVTGSVEETEDMDVLAGAIVAIIIFGGSGVWLHRFAKKAKIAGEKYRKYTPIVIKQNQTSLDYIASALGLPFDMVVNDLQEMIDNNYYAGAYIDLTLREIVIPKKVQYSAPIQEIIVICEGCGATNKAASRQIIECEYCGLKLKSAQFQIKS